MTNIGFIGTGGIARNHLKNLAAIEGVSVTAFCDIQLDRAKAAAKEWTDARFYDSIPNMLDDRPLDAVYICLPPMAHGEAESEVISREIPFLVEKPLGIESELPQKLLKSIQEKRLITSVGYHWRYQDTVAQAKQLLDGRTSGMALGYWLGGMPMVPWWRKQNGSGGQFVEQTTHITDLLRYLCGEVTEVFAAYGRRVMHEQVEGTDVADVGTVTLKLENGMVATISNSCLLPSGQRVGLDIYTNEGLLEINSHSVKDHQKGITTEYATSNNPYHTEDEVFIGAVRSGDPTPILSPYADALRTHYISMAANASAETGQSIRIKSGN